ncbi:bifunctional PTS system maltose and glucose-specific transporter subunits IICB [Shigella sonnei]|nr:bifunctional PTS system maltose and glucose-specific transporter subunits IICB [Shigella sonnei]
MPAAQRRRLAIAHKSQLFNGGVNAFSCGGRDSPFATKHQRNGTYRHARSQRNIMNGYFFGGSHADDLLPDYVTDKTFYLLFILYPLLSLRNVIYASLKFDKTFYLLAQFTESRLFSTRSRFMTAKTAPKVTLWEFFQQLGKTFMLPVALLSFCGIMLGIGSSLSSHDVITLIPVLGNPVLQAIFT